MRKPICNQQPMLHQWLKQLIGFALSYVLLATPAQADNLIVMSRQLSSYQAIADTLTSKLQAPSTIITANELKLSAHNYNSYEQIIALGASAADKLFTLVPDKKNLFISFIPRQTYDALLLKYKNHPRVQAKKVTAIYVDQPYFRQLSLVKLLTPKAKSVATALGPHSINDLSLLQDSARSHNLILKYEVLKDTDNPIYKLQPLIKSADAFLSLPDKSVFNRTTAKWVLYISFKQQIPLIGFSKKYVEAGAVASVYSSPADIGKHTAEIVNHYSDKAQLPAPTYPKYFQVSTNVTAAQSLHIKIPSKEVLTQQLLELEK